MKKIFGAMLILSVVLLVLAACGGSSGGQTTPTNVSPTTTAVTVPTATKTPTSTATVPTPTNTPAVVNGCVNELPDKKREYALAGPMELAGDGENVIIRISGWANLNTWKVEPDPFCFRRELWRFYDYFGEFPWGRNYSAKDFWTVQYAPEFSSSGEAYYRFHKLGN